jgi:guanylate kinase
MMRRKIIMSKGLLIVVSAPSGCGKGTILAEILKSNKYYYSVSATTRQPREGEINGVNYHFMTNEEFTERINNNGMLEYAVYCDNYYGTPSKEVYEKIEQGKNVILEIEVQGAMQVREKCPDAVFVFIAPPSIKELERRLNKRGTEKEDVIQRRVSAAAYELGFADKYDYIIFNAELEKAIEDFKIIVKAEKMKVKYTKESVYEVLKNA